ncbi:MAG: hypothetical protein K0Q71_2146 [Thermomicrobiales bacterium]|jgi:hypothetical protein|nr:hypothetical protein [Thermomicrobiales bacterium]
MNQHEAENLAARIADDLRARYLLLTNDRGSLIPRSALIKTIAHTIELEAR